MKVLFEEVMYDREQTCLSSSLHVLRIICSFKYREDEIELKSNSRLILLISSGKWYRRLCVCLLQSARALNPHAQETGQEWQGAGMPV